MPNLVALQKLRLELNKTTQDVKKQLAALEKGLKQHKEPGVADVAKAANKLRQAFKAYDQKLVDALDHALNESVETKRAALYKTALTTADQFLKFVEGDKLVKGLEQNTISPVPALPKMSKGLQALTKALH